MSRIDLLVRELATTTTKTVTPEFSIRNVLDLLRNNDFRHVPVVDSERRVRGVLSESDLTSSASLARMFGTGREEYESFLERPVTDLLKSRYADDDGLVTVGPDDPIDVAMERMLEDSVSALPVVESDGTLFGIISYVDVFHELLDRESDLDEEETN